MADPTLSQAFLAVRTALDELEDFIIDQMIRVRDSLADSGNENGVEIATQLLNDLLADMGEEDVAPDASEDEN